MRIENGQIKELAEGGDWTDAPTVEQATVTYHNGTKKMLIKRLMTSAVISGGSLTFYLTDDGTSGGTAVFSTVFKESANFWVDDASSQYQFGSWTLSADKKSLTMTANRLGTVLLGLIQFIAGANGVTVNLRIEGN